MVRPLATLATLATIAAAACAPRAARADDAAPAPAGPSFEERLYEILREKGLLDEAEDRELGELLERKKAAEAEPAPAKWSDRIEVDYAPGEGLTVATRDGHNRFNLSFRLQTQYRYENPDDPTDSDTSSFRVRRAKLKLRGSVWRRWVNWRLQVNFAPSDGPELEDAFVDLAYWKPAALKFGQFKVPTSRQRMTSTASQLLADRSDVTGEFTPSRDQGAMVHGEAGEWASYALGAFNGVAENAGTNDNTGLRWAARVELTPLGAFDFDETGVDRPASPRVAVDGALWTNLDAEEDLTAAGGADDEEVDEYSAQAGAAFAWDRIVAAGAFHWRKREPNRGRFSSSTDTGWFVQAGVFVHDRVQIAGRIERLEFDPDRYDDVAPGTGSRDRWVWGLGANVYLLGHTLKLQGDFFQRIYERPGPNRRDEEVRVQAQMVF